MRRLFLGLALIGAVAMAGAQGTPRREPITWRIQVKSADPWVVKAHLEGLRVRTPEVSTIALLTGYPGIGEMVAGSALFRDVWFFVNPTDNSLWAVIELPRT